MNTRTGSSSGPFVGRVRYLTVILSYAGGLGIDRRTTARADENRSAFTQIPVFNAVAGRGRFACISLYSTVQRQAFSPLGSLLADLGEEPPTRPARRRHTPPWPIMRAPACCLRNGLPKAIRWRRAHVHEMPNSAEKRVMLGERSITYAAPAIARPLPGLGHQVRYSYTSRSTSRKGLSRGGVPRVGLRSAATCPAPTSGAARRGQRVTATRPTATAAQSNAPAPTEQHRAE